MGSRAQQRPGLLFRGGWRVYLRGGTKAPRRLRRRIISCECGESRGKVRQSGTRAVSGRASRGSREPGPAYRSLARVGGLGVGAAVLGVRAEVEDGLVKAADGLGTRRGGGGSEARAGRGHCVKSKRRVASPSLVAAAPGSSQSRWWRCQSPCQRGECRGRGARARGSTTRQRCTASASSWGWGRGSRSSRTVS